EGISWSESSGLPGMGRESTLVQPVKKSKHDECHRLCAVNAAILSLWSSLCTQRASSLWVRRCYTDFGCISDEIFLWLRLATALGPVGIWSLAAGISRNCQ